MTLADEDDFTHYFNACGRLSKENTELRAEIERLRNDLAEVDGLLAALAHSSPRDRWPKGSVLGKAMDRHCATLKDTKP